MTTFGFALLLALFGCRARFEAVARGDGGAALADEGLLADSAERPNRVFMTSTTSQANFGGLAGGDTICQQAADSQNLGGTFVAVLHSSGAPPSARLAGARGWVRLDDVAIADQPTDFDGPVLNPVRIDEAGQAIPGDSPSRPNAWYGAAGATCSDWTTTATTNQPNLVSAHASFLTDSFTNCDSSWRLVCAEIGQVARVTATVETGRIAFIMPRPWAPGGGLAASDAECQADATAAQLPGTYKAFLATSTAPAGARFSQAGEPWRRVDGPRIVDAAADLVGTTPIDMWKTFIARTAGGLDTNARIWTGTTTQQCGDWLATGATGTIGSSHSAVIARLQLFSNVSCTSMYGLLCLQE